MISYDRVDKFHVGQVWQSPRGIEYKVVNYSEDGLFAVLQNIKAGRKTLQERDAVLKWVLISDNEAAK